MVTWEQALAFLNGPGAAVVAGIAISILVEYWAWFQGLGSKYKLLVYYVLCFLLPVGSTALALLTHVVAPGSFAELWWPAIWNGFAASGIGVAWHQWVPEKIGGITLRQP